MGVWITMLWQPSQIKPHVGNAGHHNPLLLMRVEPLFSPSWPRQLHSLGCCCLHSTLRLEPAPGAARLDRSTTNTQGWVVVVFFPPVVVVLILQLRTCNVVRIWTAFLSKEVRLGADVEFKRDKSQGQISWRHFGFASQENTIRLIYTNMLLQVWIQWRNLQPTEGLKMLNHHFATDRVVFWRWKRTVLVLSSNLSAFRINGIVSLLG